MQICKVFKCSDKELTVNIKAFRQQTDIVDCGVFAAANIFHILTGADIGRTGIRGDKMRDHLLQCIKSGHFQQSEKSDSSSIVFCKIKKIKFQIFCYCRFPWTWYHSKDIVFDGDSDIHWDCLSCLNSN